MSASHVDACQESAAGLPTTSELWIDAGMRRLDVLVVLVAFYGCSSAPSAEEPQPDTTAASPTAVAPEPEPAPPAPRVVSQRSHVATFVDDELDECVEFGLDWTIEPGVEFEPPSLPEMSTESGSPRQRMVELRRPCSEQFAGRTVLATCGLIETRTSAPTGTQVPEGVTLVFRMGQTNYAFAHALADDRRMRECMESGGEWVAVPEDSPEYRRASVEYHAAEAQRAVERFRRRR